MKNTELLEQKNSITQTKYYSKIEIIKEIIAFTTLNNF